jgi:hypothetical protein
VGEDLRSTEPVHIGAGLCRDHATEPAVRGSQLYARPGHRRRRRPGDHHLAERLGAELEMHLRREFAREPRLDQSAGATSIAPPAPCKNRRLEKPPFSVCAPVPMNSLPSQQGRAVGLDRPETICGR